MCKQVFLREPLATYCFLLAAYFDLGSREDAGPVADADVTFAAFTAFPALCIFNTPLPAAPVEICK
jgi:hypothetical protein